MIAHPNIRQVIPDFYHSKWIKLKKEFHIDCLTKFVNQKYPARSCSIFDFGICLWVQLRKSGRGVRFLVYLGEHKAVKCCCLCIQQAVNWSCSNDRWIFDWCDFSIQRLSFQKFPFGVERGVVERLGVKTVGIFILLMIADAAAIWRCSAFTLRSTMVSHGTLRALLKEGKYSTQRGVAKLRCGDWKYKFKVDTHTLN